MLYKFIASCSSSAVKLGDFPNDITHKKFAMVQYHDAYLSEVNVFIELWYLIEYFNTSAIVVPSYSKFAAIIMK